MQSGSPLKPFLRWVGGKRFLLDRLSKLVPHDLNKRVYREPFLGSASLYFHLAPRRAVLSDLNKPLIQCYRMIRDRPELVARYLRKHGEEDSPAYYYRTRDIYNLGIHSAAQAARFIYLNRTCFNGIFRVNTRDEFNVPYGYKASPVIPTVKDLRSIGAVLKHASLRASSYESALADAKSGDFLYLDPPYPPLNGTSYFTHYTMDRFNSYDQEKLSEHVGDLDRRGCLILLSNACTPQVKRHYKGFRQTTFDVRRFVTCKNRKHQVKELIISNY
jgi:DNA adenine methylase